LRLDYAELQSADAHERVLTFLGVDPTAPMHPPWVKTGLRRPVDNFDDAAHVARVMQRLGRDEWLVNAPAIDTESGADAASVRS
jgi:hypothetical protein